MLKRPFKLAVLVFIFIYSLAAVLVSLNRHWQYQTFYFELGLYQQALWNVSQGLGPIIYHPRFGFNSLFADHLEVTYLFLAPIFKFFAKSEFLLIIQAVGVGISGWLVFLIAKSRKISDLPASAITFSYLMFVGLQNAVITDFHPTTLVPLFLAGVVIVLDKKNWKALVLVLAATLLLREDIGLMLASLGPWLYFFFKSRSQKLAAAVMVIAGLTWSILAITVVIPKISGMAYSYQPMWPKSFIQGINSFFFPLDPKFKTLAISLANFSFLPLFVPSTWPALIFHYVQRFVLNSAGTRFVLGMHYNAPAAIILALSSISAMEFFRNHKLKTLLKLTSATLIVIPLFFHQFYLHGPLGLAYNLDFYRHTLKQGFMDDFVKIIPRGKLLMTQNNIASHVIDQPTMLLNSEYFKFSPCVVAVDLRIGQNPNNFFPLSYDTAVKLTDTLKLDQDYVHEELPENRHIFIKQC